MNGFLSDRVILHCDLNNFFASVETFFDPSLKDVPMAVCGNVEERHGIVLAKNEKAKAFGVKTAEPVWQAKAKCSELVCVSPHYDKYVEFSKKVRAIYEEYTDLVEPFGIDECWLDVTGSRLLFGSGEEIAEALRKRIKEEVGVTISVGVSFNKIFAKLGSDMKKPDAVTVISKENFKEKVWTLPADSMIGVGRSTMRTLKRMGLYTVGDVALCSEHTLEANFGKMGKELWLNFNGYNNSPVTPLRHLPPAKSYSKGHTPPKGLKNDEEVKRLFIRLAESIAHSMRKDGVFAEIVSVSIRSEELVTIERQKKLEMPTRIVEVLVGTAMELFRENRDWSNGPIRSVTLHVSSLVTEESLDQYNLFADKKSDKLEKLQGNVDEIRKKYGKGCIVRASALSQKEIETQDNKVYDPFHPIKSEED